MVPIRGNSRRAGDAVSVPTTPTPDGDDVATVPEVCGALWAHCNQRCFTGCDHPPCPGPHGPYYESYLQLSETREERKSPVDWWIDHTPRWADTVVLSILAVFLLWLTMDGPLS